MSPLRNPVKILSSGIAAVLLPLCAPVPTNAEEITFKIAIFPSNKASAGWIAVKTGERGWQQDVYPIPPRGELKVTVPCAVGVLFKARINDDYLPFDRNHLQRGCAAGEIAFLFREKAYASLIRDAVAGTALARVETNNEVIAWQSELTMAVTNNDREKSLKLSSQIYNYLVDNKQYSMAEKYRVLNFDKAKTQLGGGELAYDPSQSRYVLSVQDEALIKKLQVENKLKANGKLDWPPMETIARFERSSM
jgi:hypothetical protein